MSDPERAGGMSWWSGKVRQFDGHLRVRVTPEERRALAAWAPGWALGIFDAMHPADQRHGLDVVVTLRADGADPGNEPGQELLLAGLLHDAGKGQTGVWPRVAYSLGQAYGAPMRRLARLVPLGSWRADLDRLETHAETSARLAERAGASPRTVELIRNQNAPLDPVDGERLRLADEAS